MQPRLPVDGGGKTNKNSDGVSHDRKLDMPYCGKFCTIDHKDVHIIEGSTPYINGIHHTITSRVQLIFCPNTEYKKYSLGLTLNQTIYSNIPSGGSTKKRLHHWSLLPESIAKAFPDYIPIQIINDYNEACLIQFKSPKASATLSRICLQGIIRDFWRVKEKNLFEEINAIQDKVAIEVWDAINAVRLIGNIGAHMEKDVDLIIDVEPEEAGLLIELIETLLNDWYIQRHEREIRYQKLKEIALDKKEKKKPEDVQQNNDSIKDTNI